MKHLWKYRWLLAALLILPVQLNAQTLFRYFAYQIEPGKKTAFINGYRRNIEWHKEKGDDWSWYAWFIIDGPRKGIFFDGTPNHSWADFDTWKINNDENTRYNDLDFTHYVQSTVETGTWKFLPEFSTSSTPILKARFLQQFYFKIKPGAAAMFEKHIAGNRPKYSINWYKDVLHGSYRYILQIPHHRWRTFEESEEIYFNTKLLADIVTEIESEILEFYPSLTLEDGEILE